MRGLVLYWRVRISSHYAHGNLSFSSPLAHGTLVQQSFDVFRKCSDNLFHHLSASKFWRSSSKSKASSID